VRRPAPAAAVAAVVLDFDGLIVDTETPIFEAWLGVYQRRGHDLGLDLWQHSLGTHGGFDPLEHLDTLCSGALDREALLAEVKETTSRGCDALPLMPGVEALLRTAAVNAASIKSVSPQRTNPRVRSCSSFRILHRKYKPDIDATAITMHSSIRTAVLFHKPLASAAMLERTMSPAAPMEAIVRRSEE